MRTYNERRRSWFVYYGSRKLNIKRYAAAMYFVESNRNFVLSELAAIVMKDSFTFYKLQWYKICFLDFFMIKKCCGNDVTAFAKLSHVTYVRKATDGNMSVVALNLDKGLSLP